MTDTNTTFETIYNTIFEEQPMPNDTAPSTLIDAAGEVVPLEAFTSEVVDDLQAIMARSITNMLDLSAAYQKGIFHTLLAQITTLESRITALEAAQEEESKEPSDVINWVLDSYEFQSAVKAIAQDCIDNIDAEEIVREGLRDIL